MQSKSNKIFALELQIQLLKADEEKYASLESQIDMKNRDIDLLGLQNQKLKNDCDSEEEKLRAMISEKMNEIAAMSSEIAQLKSKLDAGT